MVTRQKSRKRTQSKPRTAQFVQREASVEIERLAHDGRGIGYLEGKIVFVEQALPGERHKINLVGGKSTFFEAVSVALLSPPASSRAAPRCQHYQSCGGCHLQHLDNKSQLAFKEALVFDQCRRNGVVLPAFEAAVTGSPMAYRARCRLSTQHKGPAFAGFRQKNQSQLIKLQECPVLAPNLERLIEPIQTLLAQLPAKALGHIELVDDQSSPILILRHVSEISSDQQDLLSQFASSCGISILMQPESTPNYVDLNGAPTEVELTLALPMLAKPLRYRPHDFTQVNRPINVQMVAQALAWAEPEVHETWLDLFCGIGNFSMPLATRAAQVIGVEGAMDMVQQAEINASIQDVKNTNFYAADLEQSTVYRRLPKQVDGVLLDPPRAGAKMVIPHLAKLNPNRILYVSCDPATFARDASELCNSGYSVEKIGILDMFPQTMHVETMALFRK